MDIRLYYIEECYGLRNCLHCPDCLAFALKYQKQMGSTMKEKDQVYALVLKFAVSTIASENLPCEYAQRQDNLREYLKQLFKGEAELPICHYEFT